MDLLLFHVIQYDIFTSLSVQNLAFRENSKF